MWAGAGYLVTDVWVGGERVVEAAAARHRRERRGPRWPSAPSDSRLLGFLLMPGFVDQAQLHARAGDGGAGAVSLRREAHVDRGGPDGGDGGHGGDVWLVASANESSLLGFRDHPFRRATDGVHGSGRKRHGARGKDIEVPVPVGTVVRDREGAVRLRPGQRRRRAAMVAEGGQGGGATRASSPTAAGPRPSPSRARRARSSGSTWSSSSWPTWRWSGFPNAGKSTLISTVSAAKPKIADYPFTTLEPHLGVVRVGGVHDGTEFVMADIPGLVEGAAEGKGLGHQFLRHIERARVLVVLLDLGAPDAGGEPPADQLRVLLAELGSLPARAARAPAARGRAARRDLAGRRRGRLRPRAVGGHRRRASRAGRPAGRAGAGGPGGGRGGQRRARSSCTARARRRRRARAGPGGWLVLGRAAERAVAFSDLTDDGAQAEAVRRLRRLGVDRALARAGVREGDEVTVGTMTFTWGDEST